MINVYDIAYGLGVGLASPYWLLRPALRAKVRQAFSQRMGHVPPRQGTRPAVLIHAVSLGEINAARGLVDRLLQSRGDLDVIVSTTTETGFARAQELYGAGPITDRVTVIRYPLDFSSAIARVLDNLRPSLVVLMELEIWPNFIHQCHARRVPVLLLNGRMTHPSYRRYRLIRPVVAGMFRRLSAICVQDPNYAQWFEALGAPAERIGVTGTMKFDTAAVADRIEGDAALAEAVGLNPGQEAVWVCGSTGPGEEQMILDVYRELLQQVDPRLRLVIVPRHPQRFDDVASLILTGGFNVIRRSAPPTPDERARIEKDGSPPVILGDTMGELRRFYSLASVVFVGRSLVDLGPRQHGSDMMEPAGLGKPVIVGPYTTNFAEVMNAFRGDNALREVTDAASLRDAVAAILGDPAMAAEMGHRARAVVQRGKGATERHVQVILEHLPG